MASVSFIPIPNSSPSYRVPVDEISLFEGGMIVTRAPHWLQIDLIYCYGLEFTGVEFTGDSISEVHFSRTINYRTFRNWIW